MTRLRQKPAVLFSVSPAFYRYAVRGLHSLFPDVELRRLAPDLGVIEGGRAEIGSVAEGCRSEPVPFVRHLARVAATAPHSDPEAVVAAAVRTAADANAGVLSLQTWASGVEGQHPEALRKRIAENLEVAGRRVQRSGADVVLTVCLAPDAAYVGLNAQADALVDWPGGRVRLARSPEQVSRSEFKLEELLQIYPLPLPGGRALDLGASPGGWSRVLRAYGYEVWAVDPGDLAPSLAADPGVHHIRATAERFLRESDQSFDLITNDMRLRPGESCRVLVRAASRSMRGAPAIVTLKISRRSRYGVVSAALRTLDPAYEVLFARQLFHNADEVTVVARRR